MTVPFAAKLVVNCVGHPMIVDIQVVLQGKQLKATNVQKLTRLDPANSVPGSTPGHLKCPLTLTEALAVISFLSGRKLLCSSCGYRLVTGENQYHAHCKNCQRDSQNYNPARNPTVLDVVLAKDLAEWVATMVGSQLLAGGASG